MAAPRDGLVASPCISLCRMHAPTGWCEGCLRTITEIAAWGRLDDDGRRVVLQDLGPRRVTWQAMQAAGTAPPSTGPGGSP
ncbi:MAG: hypothetical protein A3E25_18970 [Burkholderiales bacterium RIFCSPHIGHO2_12_FULL_69_20]|nr:MAG: hypothetical protein A3E25_18970 [Burkholderiales bacterium RIFCSPHIGHO2_12_FULL_69_20]